MGNDKKQKKVVIVVNNDAVHDARVLKYSNSLTQLGYKVEVLCRDDDKNKGYEANSAIDYIRVMPIGGRGNLYKAVAKFFIKTPWKIYTFLPFNKFISTLLLVCLALLVLFFLFVIFVGKAFKLVGRVFKKDVALFRHFRLLIIDFYERHFRSFFISLESFTAFYPVLTKLKADIIHCHDLDTLTVTRIVSSEKSIPFIYDAHELETDRNDRKGRINKKYAQIEEGRGIRGSSAVITVSQGIASLLASLYKIKQPEVIYNAPVLQVEAPKESLRQRLNLSITKPLVVYVGLVTEDRCLDSLVEAMAFLDGVHLAMVGPQNVSTIEKLKCLAKKIKATDRIHFVPPVPSADVYQFIASASVGVALSEPICKSYLYAMPNKFFEMLMAGLPVVVSNQPEMAEFVTKHSRGIVLKNNNPIEVAFSLNQVISACSDYQLSDKELKVFRKEFCWEAQLDRIDKLYESIIQ